MTRWMIGLLLVLNLATLAWQWDAFARWGWGPNTHQEPERLSRQIRPEALKIEIPSAPLQADTNALESPSAPTPPAAAESAAAASGTPALDLGKAPKISKP